MPKPIYQRPVFKLVILFGAAVAAIPLVSSATQGESDSHKSSQTHVVILPEIRPDAASSCTAEAVAYTAAVESLSAAQQAAAYAYQRWYDCEYSNYQPTSAAADIPSAEHSVLVKD